MIKNACLPSRHNVATESEIVCRIQTMRWHESSWNNIYDEQMHCCAFCERKQSASVQPTNIFPYSEWAADVSVKMR